jgi:hypothetical protein
LHPAPEVDNGAVSYPWLDSGHPSDRQPDLVELDKRERRRPAIPGGQRHRDRKNDYRRNEKHRKPLPPDR